MRIVHVITRLIIGGAQENTLLTCEGLAVRGHDVTLIAGPTTGPEGSLVDRARIGHYSFEELPNLVRQVSPLRDRRALRTLQMRFEALQPDVVHTHSSKAGILGRIAAYRAGVPIIVHTIHGMSFNRTQSWATQRLFALAERYCAKRCHAFVSVADAMTQQALAAGIGRPEQYTTIRSGIVTADFDPSRHNAAELRVRILPSGLKTLATGKPFGVAGQDSKLIVVGAIARLFPNKGYEQLIEIMQRAVAMEPDLHFLWVGDGSHRAHYEAELSRRGLRDRVTITGLLPPSEMPRVLGAIDILTHTSQWEGLPRAVVQSLLMEKPAVAFDIDGAPEVILPGQTGELIPLNDHNAFAKALVSLAREPARRRSFGQAGRARCLTMFDHRVMVDQLATLYEHLMKNRG